MRVAVEHQFRGTTQAISSYDKTKTLLGTLIQQRTGAGETDKFAGPMPVALARPMEQSTAIAVAYPHVIPWSSTKHWVFLAENSSAALTRRIVFYEYDIPTSTFSWRGFITMNFSAITGNKTIRGFRALYTTYSTGTVSASGTAVTGSGTAWTTNRLAVGGRIGFGSTDPTQITTWYEISAIGSDTSITLASSAGTVDGGTSYVIEELRFAAAITNATATNGGLFLVKGINYNLFTSLGVNINEAATTDNVRAIYWLADAATVTNTVSAGLGIDSTSSLTSHFCWVLDGTTTARIFKYDLRAALSGLSGGKSTSAFTFVTGTSATLTGTAAQTNNGRIITAAHGPGSGVKSFYFTTATRIYRCAESAITNGSTSFLTDNMVEIPPGGVNTFAATGAMQSVDYADSIDSFIIMSSGAAGVRSYITKYNAVSSPMDRVFLVDSKQIDQSTADGATVPHPSILVTAFSVWSESGIFYLCRNGTAASTNMLYAIPGGADWAYASTTNQRLVTPELATSGAVKLYRVYTNYTDFYGNNGFGVTGEPLRVYYRTTGINDNSGSWTLIDDTGNLSGVSAANSIQFMIEFRTLSSTCLPAKVYNIGVIYEDANTDTRYNPAVSKSNVGARIFAWRQVATWGGTIPDLTIRITNADNGTTVLTDTVAASANGVWEYSTNGTTWNSWSAAADTIGNYIRYTASSLPNSIPVRAVVIQS